MAHGAGGGRGTGAVMVMATTAVLKHMRARLAGTTTRSMGGYTEHSARLSTARKRDRNLRKRDLPALSAIGTHARLGS